MTPKHTSLALILPTLTPKNVYNVEYPSRSLILISEDSPGVLCPVALTADQDLKVEPWTIPVDSHPIGRPPLLYLAL